MLNNTEKVETIAGTIIRLINHAIQNMDRERAEKFLQYLMEVLAEKLILYQSLEDSE
jgi:hypothetical protein